MNTPNKLQPSVFTPYECPKCKASIQRYLGDQAQYVSCQNCWSFFKNNAGVLVFQAKFKRKLKGSIPLGYKGVYKDRPFQVVGISEVKESNAPYYWREYNLRFEDGTYGYLNEYEGHWSYAEQIYDVTHKERADDIIYKERQYQFFNFYRTVHVAAVGEFLWDVSDNSKPKMHEYIHPPYGLLSEHKNHERNWFRTEYIEKKEIQKIAGPDRVLPVRYGAYSIQPFKFPLRQNNLLMLGLIFLAFMSVIMIVLEYVNDERKIYSASESIRSVFPDSSTLVSSPFEVKSLFNSTALDVEVYAPVNNNWFEASCKLVNETTGHEYYFENGVEYYSGSDWAEGSNTNTVTLSEVPNGTYRLIVKPYVQDGSHPESYNISITQGVLLWSNFIVISIAALLIPIAIFIYGYNFNANKWSQSNIS